MTDEELDTVRADAAEWARGRMDTLAGRQREELLTEVFRLRELNQKLLRLAALGQAAVTYAKDTNDCLFCNVAAEEIWSGVKRERHDDGCPVAPFLVEEGGEGR